jgi:hypothetical protein
MRCARRFDLDKQLAEGTLTLADLGLPSDAKANVSSPPADFGTYAHWVMQCALRAQFKGLKNDFEYTGWDAIAADAHKPEPEVLSHGAQLFSGGSEHTAHNMAVTMASLAAARMPKAVGWMAEAYGVYKNRLGGHIDFLSSDLDVIVDLKTTSTAPMNGKMKPAHAWQLAAYALLVYSATGTLPSEGYIMYVHSRGEWVCRSNPLTFHSPAGQQMLDFLHGKLESFSKKTLAAATPSFGDDCAKDYCPYTSICCDRFIPRGTSVMRTPEPELVSLNPLGASNASST